MPIFSRRLIQERINALSSVAGVKHTRSLIRKLNIEQSETNNKSHLEALSATWEVALVSSFIDFGNVGYEKKISSGKTPDLSFSLDSPDGFLGEIVTISDDEQHSKNPISKFQKTLFELQRKFNIIGKGGLNWHVESVDLNIPDDLEKERWRDFSWAAHPYEPTVHKRKIIRLKLPPEKELERWLQERVTTFFREIGQMPEVGRRIRIKEAYSEDIEVEFLLEWKPKVNHSGGSYASYNKANDPERHVLWRRLLEKSDQFEGASEAVPRIVFVCDGGCDVLDDHGGGGQPNQITDIIRYFWRRQFFDERSGSWSWHEEKNLSAVVTLPIVDRDPYSMAHREDIVIKPRLFENPHASFPLNDKHVQTLEAALRAMPKPIRTAESALVGIRRSKIETIGKGSMSMQGAKIMFSSIDMLKILAGEITVDDLFRDLDNPFATALKNGQSIRSVSLKETGETDDDDLELELRDFDAAIAFFRNPHDHQG